MPSRCTLNLCLGAVCLGPCRTRPATRVETRFEAERIGNDEICGASCNIGMGADVGGDYTVCHGWSLEMSIHLRHIEKLLRRSWAIAQK
jgi:hypothetical protein